MTLFAHRTAEQLLLSAHRLLGSRLLHECNIRHGPPASLDHPTLPSGVVDRAIIVASQGVDLDGGRWLCPTLRIGPPDFQQHGDDQIDALSVLLAAHTSTTRHEF